jgi:hypothetical protein
MELLLERYALLPAFRRLRQALNEGRLPSVYSEAAVQAEIRQLADATREAVAGAVPSVEEARRLLSRTDQWYGEEWPVARLVSDRKLQKSDLQILAVGSRSLRVSDPWLSIVFTKHKRGIYQVGEQPPSQFIATAKDALLNHNLSPSAIRVIAPVSDNEGKLEAVNTWDNAFMTFGMFQWTIGTDHAAGELPALLQRVKDDAPEAFEEHFGQFGLDTLDANRTTGFLILNGKKLNTPAEKEQLRKDASWAFRFWKSGLDPRVQLAQILQALDRINSFRFNSNYRPLDKYFIGDLITSEYGMCLLLDHHVNRPGHLMNYSIGKMDILGQALKKAGLADSDPAQWGTAEERRLIDAYLPFRSGSSMTHSKLRAQNIQRFVDRGELSEERHSFSLEAVRPRGGGPKEEDFPLINFREYEARARLTLE